MELPAHPHVATRHSKMKMTRRAFKRIVGALSRRYSGEDFRSEHATASLFAARGMERKAALACLRAQHGVLDGRQSAETKKATLGSLFLYFITLKKARSIFGAGNETRTRDPDLGKVVLYQLSYSRKTYSKSGVP